MSSSECDEDYATRVQAESNRIVKDDPIASSNSLQLEYMTPNSQNNQVSKAADFPTNTRQQHAGNIGPAINNTTVQNNNMFMFNIQLNYDCYKSKTLE